MVYVCGVPKKAQLVFSGLARQEHQEGRFAGQNGIRPFFEPANIEVPAVPDPSNNDTAQTPRPLFFCERCHHRAVVEVTTHNQAAQRRYRFRCLECWALWQGVHADPHAGRTPETPTKAPPKSAWKERVMRRRLLRGESLFHDHDNDAPIKSRTSRDDNPDKRRLTAATGISGIRRYLSSGKFLVRAGRPRKYVGWFPTLAEAVAALAAAKAKNPHR